MSKTTLGIFVAIAGVGLIVGIVVLNNKDNDKPQQTAINQTNIPENEEKSVTANQSAGTSSVEIKDFAFAPLTIKIKVGRTVTWTNQDSTKHDVAPDSESADFKGSNKLLAKGESYSFTFNKAGTYAYHCTPHPNMRATVEVTE